MDLYIFRHIKLYRGKIQDSLDPRFHAFASNSFRALRRNRNNYDLQVELADFRSKLIYVVDWDLGIGNTHFLWVHIESGDNTQAFRDPTGRVAFYG